MSLLLRARRGGGLGVLNSGSSSSREPASCSRPSRPDPEPAAAAAAAHPHSESFDDLELESEQLRMQPRVGFRSCLVGANDSCAGEDFASLDGADDDDDEAACPPLGSPSDSGASSRRSSNCSSSEELGARGAPPPPPPPPLAADNGAELRRRLTAVPAVRRILDQLWDSLHSPRHPPGGVLDLRSLCALPDTIDYDRYTRFHVVLQRVLENKRASSPGGGRGAGLGFSKLNAARRALRDWEADRQGWPSVRRGQLFACVVQIAVAQCAAAGLEITLTPAGDPSFAVVLRVLAFMWALLEATTLYDEKLRCRRLRASFEVSERDLAALELAAAGYPPADLPVGGPQEELQFELEDEGRGEGARAPSDSSAGSNPTSNSGPGAVRTFTPPPAATGNVSAGPCIGRGAPGSS
eukprot:tig00000254_g22525.t1